MTYRCPVDRGLSSPWCQYSQPLRVVNEIGNETGLKLWFTFKIEGKYHLKDSIVDSNYAYTLSAYLSMTFPQNSEQPF